MNLENFLWKNNVVEMVIDGKISALSFDYEVMSAMDDHCSEFVGFPDLNYFYIKSGKDYYRLKADRKK